MQAYLGYVTATRAAKQFGIYPLNIGNARTPPRSGYPPFANLHPVRYRPVMSSGRQLDEWQLIYVSNGQGVFQTKHESRPVAPGSVMVVQPGIWHRYYPKKATGWDEYWAGFDGRLTREGSIKTNLERLAPVTFTGLHSDIIELYQRLKELAIAHPPGYDVEMGATVVLLISRLMNHSLMPRKPSHVMESIERAKLLLQESIEDTVSMTSIASQIGMSDSTFRRVFKQALGVAPYQYFLQIKIDAAKQLLASQSVTLSELAEQFAFSDVYHFSRTFKRIVGTSPTQWTQTRR